jgi:hypothetical protein
MAEARAAVAKRNPVRLEIVFAVKNGPPEERPAAACEHREKCSARETIVARAEL